MIFDLVSIKEVAPSKPSVKSIDSDQQVWDITLDQIESHTGKIGIKKYSKTSDAPQSSNFIDEENVLYSKLRPYLNKVIIPDEKGFATTELVPLRPDKDRLEKRYLLHYLRSHPFVSWATHTVAGAKMPRLSMTEFWKYKIPLPPLPIQKKIVQVLDKAQELIDLREKQIQLLDDLVQSVFYDMFGDPVTNPKGWEVDSGEELYEVKGRVGWKGYKKRDLRPSGPLVLGATHIDNHGYVKLTKPIFISEEKYMESPEIMIKKHDLLFVQRGNTIGKTCLVRSDLGESTINPVLLILRPKNYDPIFILYLLLNKHMKQRIIEMNSGSAQPMITQKSMKECLMISPPITLQAEFAQKIKKIEAQKALMQQSLQEMKNNYNSLMQRAFKGELFGDEAQE